METSHGTVFVTWWYAFKRIYNENQSKINRESTLTVRLMYG